MAARRRSQGNLGSHRPPPINPSRNISKGGRSQSAGLKRRGTSPKIVPDSPISDKTLGAGGRRGSLKPPPPAGLKRRNTISGGAGRRTSMAKGDNRNTEVWRRSKSGACTTQTPSTSSSRRRSSAPMIQTVKSRRMRKRSKRSSWVKIKENIMLATGRGLGDAALLDPQGPASSIVALLGLTPKAVKKLRFIFNTVDVDGSGELTYNEFCLLIACRRTPFVDRLFALIDLDGSGRLTFEEFVQVLGTYCMFSKEEILKFAFEAFDKDGSGTIDEQEFISACNEVNNNDPVFPGNFVRGVERFDKNDDGLIDYGEFKHLERAYPMLLWPCFQMQDRMHKSTLGEKEWKRIMKARAKKKFIEDYRATHDGAEPPKTRKEILIGFFKRRDPGSRYRSRSEDGDDNRPPPTLQQEKTDSRGGG